MKKALLLFVCAFCSLWAGRENKDYFVEPESGSRRKSDPVIKASGWSRWKLEQSRTDPMTKKEAKMEQEVVEHVTDQLKSGFLPFVYGEKTKASIYFQHERIIRLSLFMKEVFLQYDDWEPLVSAIVIKNLKDLERCDVDKMVAQLSSVLSPKTLSDFKKDVKHIWKTILPERDEKGRIDENIVPYTVRHLKTSVDKSRQKSKDKDYSSFNRK